MCTSCGCSTDSPSIHRVLNPATADALPRFVPAPAGARSGVLAPGQSHTHSTEHKLEHPHTAQETTLHQHLETALLQRNDDIARANRAQFDRQQILALNLVSSPGAGKTTLLEQTLRALTPEMPAVVIEGDQATDQDAQRIAATGVSVVQVNTGTGCHLDADMIRRALLQLEPLHQHLLFIENVGNLVCPALFDLGERLKVVLLSVTEGDDKPLKYPHMFQAAGLLLLTKTDLLPHVDFSVERCMEFARRINPGIQILLVSARTGAGMEHWYQWLRENLRSVNISAPEHATGPAA